MKKLAALVLAHTISVGVALGSTIIGPVGSAPTLGGGLAGDGYTLLTEQTYGSNGGGQAGASDFIPAETSTFNWYEGDGTEHNFTTPRGDVQNVNVAYDADNLYVTVSGGTGYYNDWTDPGGNGDQTDLFIVLDLSGGTAGGSLSSQDAFDGFDNDAGSTQKGVDFDGWTPQFALALQFYDNGGGSGGHAELERLSDHANLANEGQAIGDGGFGWDSFFDGSQAISEFQIPWTVLGFSAGAFPQNQDVRLNTYMTYNGSGYDAFDSTYGVGQGVIFEELGDVPGDDDSGGQFGASDGVAGTPNPGSNLVGISGVVGQNDEIDTIEAWLEFQTVPEPSSMVLIAMGGLMVGLRRRRQG